MAVAPVSSASRRRPIVMVAFMPRLRAGHRSGGERPDKVVNNG